MVDVLIFYNFIFYLRKIVVYVGEREIDFLIYFQVIYYINKIISSKYD